jgi:hypothetical protein
MTWAEAFTTVSGLVVIFGTFCFLMWIISRD